MTQEEKQLLLKDLSARLPYGIKLGFKNSSIILTLKDYNCFTRQLFTSQVFPEHDGTIEYGYQIYDYRPYLRPMSSMTEEEKDELKNILPWSMTFGVTYSEELKLYHDEEYDGDYYFSTFTQIEDWLNAYHFDFRGLIEMGLALEAPKGMYKTE